MTPRNDQPEHRLRRGGTLGGVLVLLSIIAALSVTTVVFAPRYLQAGAAGPPVVAAGSPVHQELADGLAALIRRSVGVLAVHQRGPTPYVEMVLWLEDHERPGRAHENELAVVSHSAVLRTITIYRLTGSEAGPRVPLDGSYAVDAARAIQPVDGHLVQRPHFARRRDLEPMQGNRVSVGVTGLEHATQVAFQVRLPELVGGQDVDSASTIAPYSGRVADVGAPCLAQINAPQEVPVDREELQ